MSSFVFIEGRVATMPDFKVLKSVHDDALMHIKVRRPFDDMPGRRDYDLIPVTMWNGMGCEIRDRFEVGDRIKITGRLLNIDKKPLYQHYHVMIVRAHEYEKLE